MRTRATKLISALAATVAIAATAACSAGNGSHDATTIRYWLWDSRQQPAYQKCAGVFEAENPGLKVNITQYGWDAYFTKLTAGFIAEAGPDVFVGHVSKLGQYTDLGVLYPLDQLDATKNIADSDYLPGLATVWKGRDGHRYGAPKDWDTVAYFYNRDMTSAAGISDEQLQTMTWNPKDGGAFEKILAHLSVDDNGIRGDQPGFAKDHVKTYGLAGSNSGYSNFGQTEWSPYTGSINWNYTNKNPWGDHFQFDDPRFQQVLNWYFGLAQKGYMAPFSVAGNQTAAFGGDKQVNSGRAAMALNGDWMNSTFQQLTDASGKPMNIRLAPTPIGPSGHRASMFTGVADVVSKQASNPGIAAKWVAFLASDTCQRLVGDTGVVFPARPAGTQAALQRHAADGWDVSPFTRQVKDGTTFTSPVTNDAADIVALLRPSLDAIYLGNESASVMTTTNKQINELLGITGR